MWGNVIRPVQMEMCLQTSTVFDGIMGNLDNYAALKNTQRYHEGMWNFPVTFCIVFLSFNNPMNSANSKWIGLVLVNVVSYKEPF